MSPWKTVGKIITLSTELLNFITLGKDNKRLRVIIWQLILTISVKARRSPWFIKSLLSSIVGEQKKKLITRSQYLIIRIAEIQRMLHDFATRWELWKKMQKSC